MTIKQLTQSKYGFDVLRAIREEPTPFRDIHQAAMCAGKTVCWTLRLCLGAGVVEFLGKRSGYRLTDRGKEALANWSPLMAMDGEPATDVWGLPS